MNRFLKQAIDDKEEMIGNRRFLHRNPEIGMIFRLRRNLYRRSLLSTAYRTRKYANAVLLA